MMHHHNYFAIAIVLLLLKVVFNHALSQHPQHLRTKIASSIAKGERRAKERSFNVPRNVCPKCQRPPIQCVCSCLPPQCKIETDVSLIILQHPAEFRRSTFSTVPLLKLVLEDVHICVGRNFDETSHPILENLFSNSNTQQQKPMLLFPGPDAWTLDDQQQQPEIQNILKTTAAKASSGDDGDDNNKSANNKQTLILIDGTWTQAARMARNSPFLFQHCQQVQFASVDTPSLYDAIRKEPQPHCLSTLEASAKALTLLDPQKGPEASEYLHASLKSLVRQQLLHTSHAPRFNDRSNKNPERQERIQEIERKLFDSDDDDAAVLGEKNKTYSYRSSQFNALAKETKLKRISEIEHEFFFRDDDDDDEGRSNSTSTTTSFRLRELRPSDAIFIDSRWPYRSQKSLKMILRCLEAEEEISNHDPTALSCCLGIEHTYNNNDTTQLCACIMRYENSSALGMIYVEEDVRRRGYASILLATATRILQERDDDCVAYILDGNTASERLFERQGWIRADPTVKRKSGRRRAKRKWIKPTKTALLNEGNNHTSTQMKKT